MKVITLDGLKAFLDELMGKITREVYSKSESDNKFARKTDAYTKAESDARFALKGEGGGSVDYQELARRIPSWQWKVTMPKTANQTVTATANGQTYTDDFYAPQGSQITFSVKAEPGYIAGFLSTTSATLANDLTVTVTDATESEEIEAGSHTVTELSVPETVSVPPKVHVLKMTADGTTKFVRVAPHGELEFRRNPVISFIVPDDPGAPDPDVPLDHPSIDPPSNGPDAPGGPAEPDSKWTPRMRYRAPGSSFRPVLFDGIFGFSIVTGGILIEWSKEINEHAVDVDLTK